MKACSFRLRFAENASKIQPTKDFDSREEEDEFIGLVKECLGGTAMIRAIIEAKQKKSGGSIGLDTDADVDRTISSLARKGMIWLEADEIKAEA